MAELPATVQVGPYTYRVEIVDVPTGDSWAYINWEQRSIQIKRALAIAFQRVALWHEVMHGINELVAKDDSKQPSDESYVKSQAPLQVDVLRRNPDLVAFLLGDG